MLHIHVKRAFIVIVDTMMMEYCLVRVMPPSS